MNSPLERVRTGSIFLAIVVLVSVIGYWALGYGWLEAIWMVVITIASVGFGERPSQPWMVQVWTIAVILFGFTAAGYTFGGLLQLMLAGELERILGIRRMMNEINKLHGHTIVVGYGRIGRVLAADLARHHQPFLIVDISEERCHEARDRGYLFLHGDATDDDILIQAGTARAKSLISGLPHDANNVFITLTARNLNPSLCIVARAEHPTSERKLRQAGATRVVMPSTIGAQQMSRLVTRPNTADLLELFAEQGNLTVEMDELSIRDGSQLVGQSIRESQAHHRFNLLVLAVRKATGEMLFNPAADYSFVPGDIAIILGATSDIARFRTDFGL